jgi:hypothetical protein
LSLSINLARIWPNSGIGETQVQVLAIVTRAEAQSWLNEQGTPTQGGKGSGSGEGEG